MVFNDRLIASIPLKIPSKPFRTYSWQVVMDMAGNWTVWPYRINPQADAPGLWRFVYKVDGETIEDYLLVHPYGSTAVNSERDQVEIISLSPADTQTLRPEARFKRLSPMKN